ncbi:hypothetical protein CONLIGDRAFT_623679 [Coniochaeta ligniaria NRRL 30616]|uniref:Zn(2)-C6 fungal-type domain-containing protein n=1 Tax=Coniochaeta ligniaria NRRL 30616 TaxID=1408157 RepID=A0A1J7J6C5_9PEZI|nr:hypothetical protein CONLIGDRAFT_623679 [Coniochaeta ligniaria NRRL 30616]
MVSPQDFGTSSLSPASARVASPAAEHGSPRAHRAKRSQVSRACARCRRLQKGCSERRPCDRCCKVGLGNQCIDRDGSEETTTAQGCSPTQLHDLSLLSRPSMHAIPTFVAAHTLDLCVDRYFSHLFPTIPILTPPYVSRITALCLEQRSDTWVESACLLTALSALVVLQVEKPTEYSFAGLVSETNGAYGRALLDRALQYRHRLPVKPRPSLELVILTFLIYACHARLCRHSQAYFFLRESATLLLLYDHQHDKADTEDCLEETQVSDIVFRRLFWIILISERSNAIRYRRPITLQVTKAVPGLDEILIADASLVGFRHLALLFRPLDTSFFALLNGEATCHNPSCEELAGIEMAIHSALEPVLSLHDTQKANLRVTQLWLRIILWQIRLRLGFLSETRYPASSSYSYPLELAKDLMLSTRDLPIESMRVHGIGLTEKLFDMACAVVDVLARVPLSVSQPPLELSFDPLQSLRYLRRLMSDLPGGTAVYTDLLGKHIEDTLPQIVL